MKCALDKKGGFDIKLNKNLLLPGIKMTSMKVGHSRHWDFFVCVSELGEDNHWDTMMLLL